MKIAVTGGIGSGKSYVCRLLKCRGIEVYDCDAAAKRLMHHSADLRRQLTELIGPDTYVRSTDGQSYQLNKAAVAQFLLASESNAHAIDAIVHPAVAADYLQSGLSWMECAILFESGFDRLVDHIIVVTAPQVVRVNRIMQRDGLSREKALEWMNRQWSQEEVRHRAHDEIVNDGRPLEPQIDRIINNLNNTKE